jgi:hypothetical protein
MRALPSFLVESGISAAPLSYEWDSVVRNRYWDPIDEYSPRLVSALGRLSDRATFALGVACCRWVLARLQDHIDISDALLQVEAAGAACVDWRYANIPEPLSLDRDAPRPVASPLFLAISLLSRSHECLGPENNPVRVFTCTQGFAMLADHLAGHDRFFEGWLMESLRRGYEHFPASELPMVEQSPVPVALFDPGFVWSQDAVELALAEAVAGLDPATNPYLRSAGEMEALGFVGQPYPLTGAGGD